MSVKPNQVYTITYTLTDGDGNIIEVTNKENPFSFISGINQILPKLEENVNGMLIGSKKKVTLSPEEAYGIYSDSAIQIINRTEFPEDSELEVGMGFISESQDGQEMPFIIKKIDGENITLDFNHPLAGRTLTFDLELLNVRAASNEELSHGHVHGPTGHHH